MTFQEAKPSRTLDFCIYFFGISRQRKNLINGRSRSEIGHPKAPWRPPVMFVWWPPGDLIFHLSTFLLLRRFLRHVGALLELSWRSFGALWQPSWGPFGGLLGASQGFCETPQGPDDEIPLRKLTQFYLMAAPLGQSIK